MVLGRGYQISKYDILDAERADIGDGGRLCATGWQSVDHEA